jgi:hypothetical protein
MAVSSFHPQELCHRPSFISNQSQAIDLERIFP